MMSVTWAIIIIIIGFAVVQYRQTKQIKLSQLSECCICNKVFPESFIRSQESLSFCADHYSLYLNHQWFNVYKIECTSQNSQKAVDLYEFKLLQWQKSKVPLIIQSSYHSNNQGIFTTFSLLSSEEYVDDIKKALAEEGFN